MVLSEAAKLAKIKERLMLPTNGQQARGGWASRLMLLEQAEGGIIQSGARARGNCEMLRLAQHPTVVLRRSVGVQGAISLARFLTTV